VSESKLPNLIDKHVGRQLRWRRNQLNLSQEALAERLGVTFQQVQKYERGANRVSAGRLYELARALDTTITFFFSGAEVVDQAQTRASVAEEAEDSDPAGPIDTDSADLVIAFASITDPRVRKNILALVKSQAAADRRDKDASDD
jgi:transcriptional regulator with XRE-family HTH domain